MRQQGDDLAPAKSYLEAETSMRDADQIVVKGDWITVLLSGGKRLRFTELVARQGSRGPSQ